MARLVFLCLCVTLASCRMATKDTPDYYVKPVTKFESPQAEQAAGYFWHVFQRGDYAHADQALSRLQAAYQANPTDPRLVELTGLAGFWKVVEHGRDGTPAIATLPLAQQSLNLLSQSQELDPGNRLTPAFVSTARYEVGAIQGMPCIMNQAAKELRFNTERYPKFHGFVEGWVLTAMLPPSHPCYDDAVEAYFETLDSCAGIRIPRIFPKVGPIGLSLVAKKSKCETVCYNTNFAPHNLEGTLLGLGDALLKRGDIRTARIVYESIPNVGNYRHWPFKEVLKQRLCNMETLRKKFVADSGCTDVSEPAMLYQSSISCSACHATNSPTISYDMAGGYGDHGYDSYDYQNTPQGGADYSTYPEEYSGSQPAPPMVGDSYSQPVPEPLPSPTGSY